MMDMWVLMLVSKEPLRVVNVWYYYERDMLASGTTGVHEKRDREGEDEKGGGTRRRPLRPL
jgi:hypothetical protein